MLAGIGRQAASAGHVLSCPAIGERNRPSRFCAKPLRGTLCFPTISLKSLTVTTRCTGMETLRALGRTDDALGSFLRSVNIDTDFLASVEFNPTLPAEIRLRENVATR